MEILQETFSRENGSSARARYVNSGLQAAQPRMIALNTRFFRCRGTFRLFSLDIFFLVFQPREDTDPIWKRGARVARLEETLTGH